METLQCDVHMTNEYVIVSKGPCSLWCSRKDGSLRPGSVTPENIKSANYLGKCFGLVGKIQFFSGGEWKLLLIGGTRPVGVLPLCGQVYCIERLVVVPLSVDSTPEILGLETQRDSSPASSQRGSSTKTETGGGGGGGGGRQKDGKEKDKLERRLMEALLRMFNDSQSFYFSVDGDITHTQQRKTDSASTTTDLPLWKKVDERFFWNKWMINDLLNITCQRALVEPWILPVIQGYVEVHTLVLHSSHPPDVLSRQTSVRSHRDSEASDELARLANEIPKLNVVSASQLLSVSEDRVENVRSDASGYDSDCDSSSNSSTGGSEEEEEELKTSGEVTYSLQTNLPEESDDDEDDDKEGIKKQFSLDLNVAPDANGSLREKGRRPLLERLRLQVRRSSSPDTRAREDSEERGGGGGGGGGIRMAMKRGLQGVAGVVTGERLSLVTRGREGGEEEDGEAPLVAVGGGGGLERQEDGESQQAEEVESDSDYSFTLALISRRSVNRAGTRYRRRGVDTKGNVANFVETEMILQAGSHHASYVIVRGSVPVFWTQPGTKYRPPPIIERGEEETQDAFKRHFDQQFSLYTDVAITNLINQSGREAILGRAFEKHILTLDSPHITYISFDFHHHFKANPSGALEQLLTATSNVNKKFKFCWISMDAESGPAFMCRQDGVFRVNCMDCLDRTNVVQTAFCREVLRLALQKLMILPCDEHLSGPFLTTYKMMWANNGDTISRQYTGTDAMKGDITRYGERKFKGMMKDGYNSAHRYYQNLFRDSYRQVLIDLMQGAPHSEAFSSLPHSVRSGEDEELWSLDREQAIAEMIQVCREELFPNKTLTVIGWALVEAAGYSFVGSSRKEEDCVVLQCREQNQLCMASYNVEDDQVNCFIRIPMEKVEKIVIGPLGTILRSSHKRLHMRLYYTLMDTKQCYFTLKTVNFTSMEEDRDILLSIAGTLKNICPTILVQEQKLTKTKSPVHEGVIHLVMPKGIADREWMDPGSESSISLPHNAKHPEAGDDGGIDEEESGGGENNEIEDEDEKEVSLSMPVSPALSHRPHPPPLPYGRHRVQRLRSQSFDDILSSVNNEQDLPPSPSTTDSLTSHARARSNALKLPSSGSESDEEPTSRNSLGVAYNHTDLVRSQPEMASVDKLLSAAVAKGTGKLNQLGGRLLRRVRRGPGRRMQSLQVPLPPRPHSDHAATSGSGSDTGPTELSVEESSQQYHSYQHHQQQQQQQLTQRLLAVGQRLRSSPPGLLRRMGVGGGGQGQSLDHAPPPSTDIGGVDDEGADESRTEAMVS